MYSADGRKPTQPTSNFDSALSSKIDDVIVALDDQPATLRRTVLKIQKRWYERNVPAYDCEGGAR